MIAVAVSTLQSSTSCNLISFQTKSVPVVAVADIHWNDLRFFLKKAKFLIFCCLLGMRLCVVTCVCLSLSFVIMFSIIITRLKLIMQPTNTKAIYQDTFVPVNHSDSPLCNCSQPQQNVQDQCWRCTFLNGGVCPIFCSAEHQIWGRWSCGKSSRAVTQSVAFTRKTRRCWSFGYS